MILVSGFNVYPNEIESVVAAHPGVLEVAAVAQEDERSGEAVALFVVKKDPNLTEQQLIDYCRGELTGYKVPKHVYFRTELPKTNVGKILRRELRDSLKCQVLARLLVILRAQLVNRRDHRASMFGIHRRVNAMAEIEHVAMT